MEHIMRLPVILFVQVAGDQGSIFIYVFIGRNDWLPILVPRRGLEMRSKFSSKIHSPPRCKTSCLPA